MHGGGGGTGPGGVKRARIEIIPLIDVIFFLLATFVLFTLSLNKSGGLNVLLPAPQTSHPRPSPPAPAPATPPPPSPSRPRAPSPGTRNPSPSTSSSPSCRPTNRSSPTRASSS